MKEYDLHGRKKLEYIWDYYKLHIIAVLILCYFIGYIAHHFITKKEVILSVAAINIEFSQGDVRTLTDGYLTYQNLNTKKYGTLGWLVDELRAHRLLDVKTQIAVHWLQRFDDGSLPWPTFDL